MQLPSGVVDPIFQHELALELKMTVAELMHGRGAPTPLHEVAVDWPLFFAVRKREAEREERKRSRRV